MTSAADTPEGRNIDARYRIVSRIADGGMATVYRAVDERLGRTVAIKIMHRQLVQGPHHAQFVERFHREARSAAAIANPHIVQVYDTGEFDGLEYLVMEYVHGVNLRHEMNQVRTFNVRETLRIIDQTLDGLASAHRANVIHRDIKPENILLNDRGHVQITDFGLAKATSQATLSSTGMLLGTAAYLPPEMIEENLATPQGDLYSVGIMAWEMLVGDVPFTSGNPITLVFKHVHEDVPSVLGACPGIDPSIAQFIAMLTARSLHERPRDAGVASEQLHRVMAQLSLDAWQFRHIAQDPPSLSMVPLLHSRSQDDGTRVSWPSDGNVTAGVTENGKDRDDNIADDSAAGSNDARTDKTRVQSRLPLRGPLTDADNQPPEPPEPQEYTTPHDDGRNRDDHGGSDDTSGPTSATQERLSPTASFDSFLAQHLGSSPGSSDTFEHDTEAMQDMPRTVTNRDRGPSSATATQSIAALGARDDDAADSATSAASRRSPSATRQTVDHQTVDHVSGGEPRSRRRRWRLIAAMVAVIAACATAGWWYMLGPGSYWSMPRPDGVVCPVHGACPITRVAFSDYRSTLQAEGIPYRVDRAYSDTIPSGSIISTKPADVSDRLSKRHGDSAAITVSLGVRRVTIPRDIDDPSTADGKDPLAALKRAGFTAIVHDADKDEYSQTLPEHALQSIDPNPGTTLNHNARITVVLSKGPMPVSMPDVVGRSQKDAQASFDDAKLKVSYTQEFSDDVDQGSIISASVPKGTELHWGDHVDAVVSKGPEMADVPNVVFSHPDDARKQLEALGFRVKINGTPILNLIRQQSAVGATRLRDTNGNPTVITLELV